jgi:transmembrane sensor
MASNEPSQVSDGLLIKYLLGEADEAETAAVERWLAESEAHRKQFADFSAIWRESEAFAAKSEADEHIAWNRFLERAKSDEPKRKTISFTPQRNWLSAAAILLVLITGGYLLYRTLVPSAPSQIVLRAAAEVRIDTLPDGSVVTRNKGATLAYAADFEGRERLVTLEGEAFFEVKRDEQKPFVIEANEARVQVFGTSFNVQTSAEKTVVIVATGVVEVAKNEHAVRLTANEKAVVTREASNPTKEKNEDQLYQYYRNREFVLNGTPLWRFAEVLGQAYNVNITIANDEIRNLKLTTVFKDQPLQDILTVVGETLHVSIEQKGTDIVLR